MRWWVRSSLVRVLAWRLSITWAEIETESYDDTNIVVIGGTAGSDNLRCHSDDKFGITTTLGFSMAPFHDHISDIYKSHLAPAPWPHVDGHALKVTVDSRGMAGDIH